MFLPGERKRNSDERKGASENGLRGCGRKSDERGCGQVGKA